MSRYYHSSIYDQSLGRLHLFGGKTTDNLVASDIAVLSVRGDAVGEWKKEEKISIEVLDMELSVFHCILASIYSGKTSALF